jgi:GNAT superfamily N-acetyltransferase
LWKVRLSQSNVLRTYPEFENVPGDRPISVFSLSEIAAEKIVVLHDKTRNEPGDLYDLWFLTSHAGADIGPLIGAKRLYLWCFATFTLSSALCGAAWSAESLVVFRVLQGMSGGLLAPMAQMMLARAAGKHPARGMGYAALPIHSKCPHSECVAPSPFRKFLGLLLAQNIGQAKNMNDPIRYFAPVQEDAASLGAMARQAFSETFAHLYDPAPFTRFLDQAYGPGGTLETGLANPSIRWRVAAMGDQLIGYAKLSPLMAPAPKPQSGALELQQIYVLKQWHGQGVAEELMKWALDTARGDAAPEIYLTVFDHNARAKSFYTRHGFSEVGNCTFQLGDRIDDDRIWRKAL